MSRSVSLPSSVTKTSPCWNGLIVPGSMFRYGSNFCTWTLRPRALSSRPSDAATMPLPSADTTPPVTNTYLVGLALIRSHRFRGERPRAVNLPRLRTPRPSDHRRGSGRRTSSHRRQEFLAAEHPLDLVLPLALREGRDRRPRRVAGDLLDPEVALGARSDLREVRDRHDLGARREPLQ